jgi:5'-3' exonuclease
VKVHLVDATFELFRAYYSRPIEHAPDGRPVNAVHGLVESMLSLLREPDLTHVAAATDHVIPSWRNDLYAGYKTDAGVPPQLLAQFEVARLAGDPAIEQIVICSVDKDLAQCVRGDRVILRDRMRSIEYDEAGVLAKYGVPPASIPDWLALVGDAADGYPGLPGWGAKSAAAVLRRFGQLDAIPASPLDWEVPLRGASRLAATLVEQRSAALLYRTLATLRTDCAIDADADRLTWRGVPREAYLALCEELGFRRLSQRVLRWAEDPPPPSA